MNVLFSKTQRAYKTKKPQHSAFGTTNPPTNSPTRQFANSPIHQFTNPPIFRSSKHYY